MSCTTKILTSDSPTPTMKVSFVDDAVNWQSWMGIKQLHILSQAALEMNRNRVN